MGRIRHDSVKIGAFALTLSLLTGCGDFFEDNGTHLAAALGKGAAELRQSGADELVVRFETLDAPSLGYYVEITPSLGESKGASGAWSSYIVVSGKRSGGTSSHNAFVFVPNRLYIKKPDGGPTEIVLHKDGDRISVVAVR